MKREKFLDREKLQELDHITITGMNGINIIHNGMDGTITVIPSPQSYIAGIDDYDGKPSKGAIVGHTHQGIPEGNVQFFPTDELRKRLEEVKRQKEKAYMFARAYGRTGRLSKLGIPFPELLEETFTSHYEDDPDRSMLGFQYFYRQYALNDLRNNSREKFLDRKL